MESHIEAHTPDEVAQVAFSPLWTKRRAVDLPLTDEQYGIFKKSYAPDWDCRFAPVYVDGWFYITRSGYWLFKFKYQKNKEDGLWHITENYDTPLESGFRVMLNVLSEGYFEPRIFHPREIQQYMDAVREADRLSCRKMEDLNEE